MLILASASPRRRELLTQAGYSFQACASAVPEQRQPHEDAIPFASRLAREKAEAVFAIQRSRAEEAGHPLIVLGADTVVACDQEVLGKPADPADAARMLRLLSGRTHAVITGVAVVSAVAVDVASETTFVTMQTLSDAEIAAYIETGEPMDKAGAYAIQGYAGRWVPRIHGCYFNVVGLPLALTAGMLEGMRQRLRRATDERGREAQAVNG